MPSGFFVTENFLSGELFLHTFFSNSASQTYNLHTLRGALTDGHGWIFIIVMLNPDDDGILFQSNFYRTLTLVIHK